MMLNLCVGVFPKKDFQGCRFVPEKHVRKQSATDEFLGDLNIGNSPGFGGFDERGQIWANPGLY